MKRFETNALIMGMVILCGAIVAALGGGLDAAAPAKALDGIYINYGHGDTIDVIDFGTNKVVRTIKGVPGMHGMSFSPDGKRIYVVSDTEKLLCVVDQKTGEIIKTVPLSGPAHSTLALTRDGKQLFVGIWNSWPEKNPNSGGALDIFDTSTLARVKSIPMKSGLHDLELTPDGKYVVAGSPEGHSITVVDVQTEQPVWDLNFDGEVLTMAVEAGNDGSTRRIFLDRGGFHGIEVVDFAKRQVVDHIALPETDKFKKFKVKFPDPLDPGASPAHGIGIAPDKKTLWANSRWGDAVFIYSLPDLKLLGHVNVGRGPNWIAFSPDSKTVYDGNAEDKSPSLSVIDAKTLEVAPIQLAAKSERFFAVSLP